MNFYQLDATNADGEDLSLRYIGPDPTAALVEWLDYYGFDPVEETLDLIKSHCPEMKLSVHPITETGANLEPRSVGWTEGLPGHGDRTGFTEWDYWTIGKYKESTALDTAVTEALRLIRIRESQS